ncbi:MAG: phosphoribosylanthranilate isomerase [Raineya sp.]
MKVKVCGMKYEKNIREIATLDLDFLGFIFYDKSPRFVGKRNIKLSDFVKKINKKKVGVFVEATTDFILENVEAYQLDLVQLHGGEMPSFCKNLKEKLLNKYPKVEVIKVFAVQKEINFEELQDFIPHINYFLFDTKGKSLGGNGTTFDWEALQKYPFKTPFFLSGGIDIQHISALPTFSNLPLYALDINSRFELNAGLKDINKIQDFLLALREFSGKNYSISE